MSLELIFFKKYPELFFINSLVSSSPKNLLKILSKFVSIANTFSLYANESKAFFVYGPTPGNVSKFG